MFPLSATFSTLPDFEAIRGGKIEEVVGDLFNLFLFYGVLSHSFFFFFIFSLFGHLYQPIGERCIPFTRALFYGKIEYKILLR